ncbi:MAG TPA: hypothetical protein VFL91_05655 [Thermomicrobiales bacterium]|nr:hypothetical protein [Thermomicrobiales bacterium]
MTNPRTPAPMSATMTAAEEATPHDAESAAGATPSAAEIAVLRARLREVEAALGLPLRPGQPTPPDLPALRRRVAALERHLGIVPGLVPLPGCDGAAEPARATVIMSQPTGRRGAWRERGRAALAVAALIAALAWLLHPLPGGPGSFPAAQASARPAAGAPAAAQAPVAAPASAPPCAFAEGCAREEPAPEPVGGPAAAPGEEPPARADYRAQHEDLSPAVSAPVASASLPGTPRLQPQLAWLDARDSRPIAGGAPPPQDDGHNPGPR